MRKFRTLLAGLSFVLAWLLAAAGPADAANNHSWVSSTGTGAACTRTAPCSTIDLAVTATNAGGVISVLDPGDYGIPNIPKSLTIRAEGVDGGFTGANNAGFFMTINAAPTDVVTLEGLQFSGTAGVIFFSGGQLHVVKCVISNGTGFSGNAGIKFAPNSASKLTVTDTVITNEGSVTGGGIVINPQAGGSAQVALERVTVNGNAFGVAVDGSGSTAGINVTIADSMIANNIEDGIIATTPGGGAAIGLYVKNTKSANNAFGIRALGTNVTVRADGSSIVGNTTGLSFSGGAALLTFGNNAVRANGSDGVFSGPVALQ
jgi:hypothetical protein